MKKSTMLTATSEYALRALIHMAQVPNGAAILGRDLAERADSPANYLTKILWALGNTGIIDATRGSGGGYRLRRKPEEIHLVEVVELFDRAKTGHACFLGGKRDCNDIEPCSAHAAWREVKAAYMGFLQSTTIRDIATHQNVSGEQLP
jgi:Rrf2 family protein